MAKKGKAEKEKQRPTHLFLYLGVAETGKGQLRHVYLPVKEGWEKKSFPSERPNVWSDETCIYTKRFGFVRPGTVISIEHDPKDPCIVYGRSAHRMGALPDKICALWSATSDAIKTAHEMLRKSQKDGARDLQMEMLEPLRAAYRRLRSKHQRAAFIARVSVYLTS